MIITYDIERQDAGRWHGDIGESTEWPSIETARAAVESLRSLGAEWLGTYRILEHTSRQIVARIELNTGEVPR